SGTKQWITNGSFAGTVLLFARTDQETPGAKGVSAFILDGDQVRVTREEEKLGLTSSSTSDLAIEERKSAATASSTKRARAFRWRWRRLTAGGSGSQH